MKIFDQNQSSKICEYYLIPPPPPPKTTTKKIRTIWTIFFVASSDYNVFILPIKEFRI